MGLLERGKLLVLMAATLGGCMVTGIAWLGTLWILGAIFGTSSAGLEIAGVLITVVAIVAMVWFIWWLVMRFLPRMERAIDGTTERLMGSVSLAGPRGKTSTASPAEVDDGPSPSLEDLDARLAPSAAEHPRTPEAETDLSGR